MDVLKQKGKHNKQIKEKYATLFADPDVNYFVSLCEIRKKDQPAEGGWRWHKWGEYI